LKQWCRHVSGWRSALYLTEKTKLSCGKYPHEMLKNGCNLKVKTKAQPLPFGGYGLGVIEEIITIDKVPIITK